MYGLPQQGQNIHKNKTKHLLVTLWFCYMRPKHPVAHLPSVRVAKRMLTFWVCYKVHSCIILSDSHFLPNPWHHIYRNVIPRSFICAISCIKPIPLFIWHRIHSANIGILCYIFPRDGVELNIVFTVCGRMIYTWILYISRYISFSYL